MKKILEQLQRLDFSQYESRAYLSLLKQSDVTGYELAKNSGIPASKIYQVINKLMQKEVILALDTEPVRYAAIPPDAVLSRLKSEYVQNIDALELNLNRIYARQQPPDNYIWNITGRDTILSRIRDFIEQAEREIYLSIWDEELSSIEPALEQADNRGIPISIVHYGLKKLGIGHEYRHGREHRIRRERGARRIALAVDETNVVLAHFLEDGTSHAARTSNKGLVLLTKDYIIHDIYTIRIAEKFGEEANSIFERVS